MRSFRIKSIVYESVNSAGVIEEKSITNNGYLTLLEGIDHTATIWYATDLPDAINADNIIVGCKTLNVYSENGAVNQENTLIDIIKDGSYDLVICARSTVD